LSELAWLPGLMLLLGLVLVLVFGCLRFG
jgi:hypothetical protein